MTGCYKIPRSEVGRHKIDAGGLRDTLVTLIDLALTFIELAGGSAPAISILIALDHPAAYPCCMMQHIAPDDSRLRWKGAVSLEKSGGVVRPWRIPHREKAFYPAELAQHAASPAGVRVCFATTSTVLRGGVEPPESAAWPDLIVDGEPVERVDSDAPGEFAFALPGEGRKTVELWLPLAAPFGLAYLEIDVGTALEASVNSQPRWVTYGSSITQCSSAASPAQTWPALVARTRQWDLTCLGFGGQCHLDIEMARLLRGLPTDCISLCAGINIYNQTSLNQRTFGSALSGFVRLIREGHPKIPVLLLSPIFGCEREETANATGWTLADYRGEVHHVADRIRSNGDNALYDLDGLELLGAGDAGHLPDSLHPDAEGYRIMADRFLEKTSEMLPPISRT